MRFYKADTITSHGSPRERYIKIVDSRETEETERRDIVGYVGEQGGRVLSIIRITREEYVRATGLPA